MTSPATTSVAQSELQEYLYYRQQRRRLLPRAALVGLVSGLMAVLFRAVLASGDNLRLRICTTAHQMGGAGGLIPVCYSMCLAALAVFLVVKFSPDAAGSGIPHLEAVLHRYRAIRWKPLIAVKFLGGAASLSSGLVLGREGPTVQMGGAVGDAISRWLKVTEPDRMVLIAAGAGAGLAAAFNAPLSGLVFVLEEVQRDFRPAVFGSAFVAATVADIVARFASGQLPVFHVPACVAPPMQSIPLFILLGAITGVIGVGYCRSIIVGLNLLQKTPRNAKIAYAAFMGAAAGIAGYFHPDLIGGGHHLAERVLSANMAFTIIPMLLLARIGLSVFSYATGAPGGIFAPLLGMGALTGLAVGLAAHNAWPSVVPQPAAFAVAGMAAMFTAIVRAPLTGIVLIVEMTGSYSLMLPLLMVCFCAYAVAELLGEMPIYENLLERDLRNNGIETSSPEPFVLHLEVMPGAPFDGCLVQDLGLPPGCILLKCEDQEANSWVPTATTRLVRHLQLTALISPEVVGGVEALKAGCDTAI